MREPVAPLPAIPVVCALIERSGLVLLAQRPPHKQLPLKWEFPGGKVEADEGPAAALAREIREELGCDIVIDRALPRCTHAYPSLTVEMIPFVVRLAPGSPEPAPTEHAGVQWVRPAELASFDLAAADLPVVASYLDTLA